MRRRLLIAVVIFTVLSGLPAAAGCDPLSRLKTDSVETRVVTVGRPEEQADSNSMQPAISADGRYVAFASDATNLVNEETGGGRGVFVKDTRTGETERVSSDDGGRVADGDSEYPSISADGRYIAFQSNATTLAPSGAGAGCVNTGGIDVQCTHIYVKDRESGAIDLVSTDSDGKPAVGFSEHPAISADGRYIAFRSTAENLVDGDGNGEADIFVKDTQTGFTTLVSSDSAGGAANGPSDLPAITDDGRIVAFKSLASNLAAGDVNGASDVFIKDRDSGITTLVSKDGDGVPGNRASGYRSLDISGDGNFVAFDSEATNLSPADDKNKSDIFAKNITTGETTLVSADAAGTAGDDDSYASVSLSGDGRLVAFHSNAANLVPSDGPNKEDVFVRDISSGKVTLVSASAAGAASGPSKVIVISADGRYVAFVSAAAGLVEGDTNGKDDIFIRELSSGRIRRVSTSSSPEETRFFNLD